MGHRTGAARRLGEPLPRRVALLRALQLGDLLCAVPSFRALRQALPEAEITLIGLPWAERFAERFDCYLDSFLEFPGYPGLPERPFDPRTLPAFLAEAQQRQFDLVIQLHGSGQLTNPLVVLLGARNTAGYYIPGQYCPDPQRYAPYPSGEHEVRRWLGLMEFLGVPPQGTHLEFPLQASDGQELTAIEEAASLRRGEYICVHPGSREATRRWPAERFARVADELAAAGVQVVLTGSAEERPLAAEVAGAMRCRPIDLAGRTTLGSLAALLAGARLLVSNDTGVSHLAAALGVPSVVVFTITDPRQWAPLDGRLHRVVQSSQSSSCASDCQRVLAAAREFVEGLVEPQAAAVPAA